MFYGYKHQKMDLPPLSGNQIGLGRAFLHFWLCSRVRESYFGASRKFRILAVIDDCCRANLCLIVDTSISGARVARELDALIIEKQNTDRSALST